MKREPWHPAEWEPADAKSLQALATGAAEPEQQKRALDWIIKAAMTYDETFVPGQADVSNFLAGRRNVGTQIVKLLRLDVPAYMKASEAAQRVRSRPERNS